MHEARDNARQGPFHARRADDYSGSRELVPVVQQPVQSCNSNVIEKLYTVPHHLCRDDGFFRDGNVASARRDDEDWPFPRDRPVASDANRFGKRMKCCIAPQPSYGAVNPRVGARDQYIVCRLRTQHPGHDTRNLLRSLPLCVNDLSKALAQSAMVIDLGETEVFEWQMPQSFGGLRDRKAVSSYVVESWRMSR